MGTRRKTNSVARTHSASEVPVRGVTISSLARRCAEFHAAESYPLEVAGYVIGSERLYEAVSAITTYIVRTDNGLTYDGESKHLAEDFFGDSYVAEFHSHPGELPTLSRGKDLGANSDLEHMEDEDFEWIVSVWPGKRKWRFQHRLYTRNGNGPRRVPILWGF